MRKVFKTLKFRFHPTPDQERRLLDAMEKASELYNIYITMNSSEEVVKNKKYSKAKEFMSVIETHRKEGIKLLGVDLSFLNKDPLYTTTIENAIKDGEMALMRYALGISNRPKVKKKSVKTVCLKARSGLSFRDRKLLLGSIGECDVVNTYDGLPDRKDILLARVKRLKKKYFITVLYVEYPGKHELALKTKSVAFVYDGYCASLDSDGAYNKYKSFDQNKRYISGENRLNTLNSKIKETHRANFKNDVEEFLKSKSGKMKRVPKNVRGTLYEKAGSTNELLEMKNKASDLYSRLNDITISGLHWLVNEITKDLPERIILQDISVPSLIMDAKDPKKANEYLRKRNYQLFKTFLTNKCTELGIELLLANKNFYPHKICSKCGRYNKHAILEKDIFVCGYCHKETDAGLNNAINIYNTDNYKVIVK